MYTKQLLEDVSRVVNPHFFINETRDMSTDEFSQYLIEQVEQLDEDLASKILIEMLIEEQIQLDEGLKQKLAKLGTAGLIAIAAALAPNAAAAQDSLEQPKVSATNKSERNAEQDAMYSKIIYFNTEIEIELYDILDEKYFGTVMQGKGKFKKFAPQFKEGFKVLSRINGGRLSFDELNDNQKKLVQGFIRIMLNPFAGNETNCKTALALSKFKFKHANTKTEDLLNDPKTFKMMVDIVIENIKESVKEHTRIRRALYIIGKKYYDNSKNYDEAKYNSFKKEAIETANKMLAEGGIKTKLSKRE